jgi:hypothetical protein
MAIRRLIQVKDRGPLKAVQELLMELWRAAALEGMLAPLRRDPYTAPTAQMVFNPEELQSTDPFAPVMVRNAAVAAVEAMSSLTDKNVGLFLRPCEIESLRAMQAQQGYEISPAILISSDCLSVFSKEDYEQRVQGYDDPLDLTRQMLQFSAQGGILPSRYQSSCQLCQTPYPENVDIHIETIGITTEKHLVVGILSKSLANQLETLIDRSEPVPASISDRRQRTLENLRSWRDRSTAFANAHFPQAHDSIDDLISHLVSCSDCCDRLRDFCPLFDDSWLEQDPSDARDRMSDWLISCAGCGICEYKCPRDYPLFHVIAYLNRKHTAQVSAH